MAQPENKKETKAVEASQYNTLLDAASDEIAWDIGDTFIRFDDMTPVEQWRRIHRLLEENGYHIHKY